MLLLAIFLCSLSLSCGATIRAAPYYMPLDNDPQDIAEAIKASGVKQFIFAFVLAPSGGGCTPTWDGKASQKVSVYYIEKLISIC